MGKKARSQANEVKRQGELGKKTKGTIVNRSLIVNCLIKTWLPSCWPLDAKRFGFQQV